MSARTQELTPFRLRPLGQPLPLKLYTIQENLNSACVYYRLLTPWKTAQEMGLGTYEIDDQETMCDEARVAYAPQCDVHMYYLILSKMLLKRIKLLQKLPKIWDPVRKQVGIPPVVIFDSDDDLATVDPMNPKFVSLGTHHVDGTPLGRGDRIMMQLDDSGDAIEKWCDGKIYQGGQKFDIVDNWKRLHLYRATARMADACTVTNENLATSFRALGAKRVYVFPNSVRFQDYPRISLRTNPRQVKILWQGGWSHYRDWFPLRDALGRVSERYPQARFIFWGMQYQSVHGIIPATRREWIPWMPHDAYILKLSTIGHDVNLCPLAQTKFNRAKSAIKWYESSAVHRPAATLAQAVGPYLEIEDRKTGLLWKTPEEFEARLGELIEDATLRKRLAENAKDWVRDFRSAERTVPGLIQFYRQVIEEAR